MLLSSLENYLIRCRDQHLPFEIVAANLTSAGWSPDDILSAKYWYSGQTPPLKEVVETKIHQSKVFVTPPALEHYPNQRLSPILLLCLFAVLTIVTFLVLRTF